MKRWITAIGVVASIAAVDNTVVGQTCGSNEVLCGTQCVEPLEGFYFCDAGRGIEPHHVSAVAGTGEQSGAAAADFDNDGYVDLFIPQAAGTPDLLYRYDSGLQGFVNVASQAGLDSTVSGRGALWLDFDNDGWLDLFVMGDDSSSTPIFRLYRNDIGIAAGCLTDAGIDCFVPVAPSGFPNPTGGQRGGLCAGDIDIDVYVATWDVPSDIFLFRNDGNGLFAAAGMRRWLGESTVRSV